MTTIPLGTRTDNANDKITKGRVAKGEMICRRLSSEDVLKIRADFSAGESQTVIAEKYGVHQTNISYIVRRKTWSWL